MHIEKELVKKNSFQEIEKYMWMIEDRRNDYFTDWDESSLRELHRI